MTEQQKRVIAAARYVSQWRWREIIPDDGMSNQALIALGQLSDSIAALDREEQQDANVATDARGTYCRRCGHDLTVMGLCPVVGCYEKPLDREEQQSGYTVTYPTGCTNSQQSADVCECVNGEACNAWCPCAHPYMSGVCNRCQQKGERI